MLREAACTALRGNEDVGAPVAGGISGDVEANASPRGSSGLRDRVLVLSALLPGMLVGVAVG